MGFMMALSMMTSGVISGVISGEISGVIRGVITTGLGVFQEPAGQGRAGYDGSEAADCQICKGVVVADVDPAGDVPVAGPFEELPQHRCRHAESGSENDD